MVKETLLWRRSGGVGNYFDWGVSNFNVSMALGSKVFSSEK